MAMDTTWFTPTILFFLVNLMILVIFLASYSKSHNPKSHNNSPQLTRSSSLLARVKSLNFSFNRFDSHYPFQSETRFTDPVQNHYNEPEIDNHNQSFDHQVRAPATSEGIPVAAVSGRADEEEEVLARRPATMKKSASERTVTGRETEVDSEVQRPATARARKPRVMERAVSKTLSFKGDVDAKADDFIKRFKQQLKLQKLDSIKRYTEMLTRGTGAAPAPN